MEANELRIGNLVWRPCYNDKVVEIRENGIIGLDNLRGIIPFSELKPVPITKKWIAEHLTAMKPILDNAYNLEYNTNNDQFELVGDDEITVVSVQFVHDLQNAVFVLTGEEMEIE